MRNWYLINSVFGGNPSFCSERIRQDGLSVVDYIGRKWRGQEESERWIGYIIPWAITVMLRTLVGLSISPRICSVGAVMSILSNESYNVGGVITDRG